MNQAQIILAIIASALMAPIGLFSHFDIHAEPYQAFIIFLLYCIGAAITAGIILWVAFDTYEYHKYKVK